MMSRELRIKAILAGLPPAVLLREAVLRYPLRLRRRRGRCGRCGQEVRFQIRFRRCRFQNSVTVRGVPAERCPACGDETFSLGLVAEVEQAVSAFQPGSVVRLRELVGKCG